MLRAQSRVSNPNLNATVKSFCPVRRQRSLKAVAPPPFMTPLGLLPTRVIQLLALLAPATVLLVRSGMQTSLAGRLFNTQMGVSMAHIPYKGALAMSLAAAD